MTKPILTDKWTWSLRGVLVAALVYSALTLASRPAYATSCDCQALQASAAAFCADTYRFCGELQDVVNFQCNPQTGFFSYECWAGGEYCGPLSGPCS